MLKHGESRINFMNTLNLIKQADHPNLVKLFEIYEEEHYIHFVTEYIEGGELFDFLKERNKL